MQIREKHADTAEVTFILILFSPWDSLPEQFLKIALESQAICKRYNIPIFINDRIDIALAIRADGVHLGQTDMPVSVARNLLPKGTLIGVSCNTEEHIVNALKDDADYIGIGAVWGTTTKNLTRPVIGVRGVGELLRRLDGSRTKAVAIGNHSACQKFTFSYSC